MADQEPSVYDRVMKDIFFHDHPGFLLAERYRRRRVVQTVIYFGDAPLRMPDRLDTGAGRVRYRLIDIRQFEAMDVAAGGAPADLVLATLARGGRAHLKELLARIIALPPELRNRALAQVALLAGLRRMAGIVTMEMNRMGLAAEFSKNELLREYFEEAENRGLAKGRVLSLCDVLEARFGALPPWAKTMIDKAEPAQIERWLLRSVSARSLETLLKS